MIYFSLIFLLLFLNLVFEFLLSLFGSWILDLGSWFL